MINETGWILDILRRLLFDATEGEDSYAVAVEYIKGQFVWDILATVPQAASYLGQKFVFMKVFRLSQLSLVVYPIEIVFGIYFSKRDKKFITALQDAMRTFCYLMILMHYLACLWIFVGSKFFVDYEKDAVPWMLLDPDF